MRVRQSARKTLADETYKISTEKDEDVCAGENRQEAVVHGGVYDYLPFEPVVALRSLPPDGRVADGNGNSWVNKGQKIGRYMRATRSYLSRWSNLPCSPC